MIPCPCPMCYDTGEIRVFFRVFFAWDRGPCRYVAINKPRIVPCPSCDEPLGVAS